MKKILLSNSFPEVLLKLIHGSVIIMLFLLLFSSCSKILEEKPKSLAIETYYTTSGEIQTAVNSIYAPLRGATNAFWYFIGVNTAHSDYAYGRGSWAGLNDFDGFNGTWITRTNQCWTSAYQSIRNANIVIKNAPLSKGSTKADIDGFVAEAKFLRAFVYFIIVREWGGVPIRTESNMRDVDCKKSTTQEIYNFIISDLKEAETNLPDVAAVSGRPSKWAAKTLLADVYLQIEKFAEARDKANEVIQANKYSLVVVNSVDDFQKIFGPTPVTTAEEIFYLKFSHDPGQGTQWPLLLNHPGTKLLGGGGVYGIHSYNYNPVYQNWDGNDLRKGLWYLWDIGVGPGSILSKKFIDPTAIDGGSNGNPETYYRYADLLLIYAEAAGRAGSGPTAEAIEALNKVHRRAYGYNPTTSSVVDFKLTDYTTTSFLDLIVKERGYEFQLEGKRYLELRRTGKLKAIILAAKGKIVSDKDLLWPIPVDELTGNKALNPATDQNPGY